MDPESRVALSERPIIDTIAAGVLATLHWLLISRWFDPWGSITDDSRMVIYQTGAGVVAVVASLSAVGLATGGAGERRQALRRLYGPELRRNWRAQLLLSVLGATACVVAMVGDGNDHGWAPYLFEFALVWTVLRMLRLVWLIDALLALEDADSATTPRQPAPSLSGDLQDRLPTTTAG